eukprot:s590_g24.t1
MASSSSNPSKRKREENKDAFFSCMGLGVPDSAVRTIMSKLKKDKTWDNSYWRSEKFRFKTSLENVQEEVIAGIDGAEVTLYVNNLQRYVDSIAHQAPAYTSFLQRVLREEQNLTSDGIHANVYLDECVPGNILQPDNARKSYCVYFCFKCLAEFRSILHWWPVALLRHSQIDLLQDGLPEFFTRVVRLLAPILSGLVLGDDTLIVTKKLFLIADEAAIKAAAGSKGASGLRPCLHCDAFSKDRSDMASSLGSASIASPKFDQFRLVPDSEILDILHHLQHVRQTQTKTALVEAQKLLGWVLNESVCFLQPDLCAYLQPTAFQYDAMHCYWSNGQVNCEVGLFFTEAVRLANLDTLQLASFFDRRWKRAQIRFDKGCSVESLFNKKY